MKIASDETHRSLAYLVATVRYGKPMPVELFEAYASAPDPAEARYRTVGGIAEMVTNQWISVMGVTGTRELASPAESASAYLDRVGWAEIVDGMISPTALGSVVLQALNAPTVDVSNEDPLTVVIDPADPLAYAKVFGLIVSRDAGLLVDPYLRLPEFYELLDIQAVTRILLSNNGVTTKRPIIATALAAINGRVEVRFVEEKLLHDRFFIPDQGDVLVFGSSLNSLTRRPGVVTPLADVAASGAIRDAYKKLWMSGTPIEPSEARKASE
ncbi:hypothetical protein E3T23_14790 [Cryobacterium cheniae]|uniref:Uncharacterized protein n=1 Tax=Cryobacterium cheniae TaxID=1259262 RepID=A0A4R8XIJ6_9MICO|nr:hypothetical protein [Cryobacterium cheniae]TFC75811.1 hypothetical protein E3T23_14790 [Cryobacterium cheniae]